MAECAVLRRRAARTRLGAAVAVCATAAACSLTTDLDGLTGGGGLADGPTEGAVADSAPADSAAVDGGGMDRTASDVAVDRPSMMDGGDAADTSPARDSPFVDSPLADRPPEAAREASSSDSGCPTTGAAMNRVGAGAGLCVDTTEVTITDYSSFLAAGPSLSILPAECGWKTSYDVGCGGANLPVTCVDWCDAEGYCLWAGKRLCGAVGSGGPSPTANAADPTQSEWMAACSQEGAVMYPYGNAYNPTACNTQGTGLDPVALLATCQGGYPGLYDMSGNADEWTNDCDLMGGTGKNDTCLRRGGFFNGGAVQGLCAFIAGFARSSTGLATSFRCCAP